MSKTKGLRVHASAGEPVVTVRLKAPTLKVRASAGVPRVTAKLSPPKRQPPKPPWQWFMDLNVNAMKWLAPWILPSLIWDIGKLALGLMRQHQPQFASAVKLMSFVGQTVTARLRAPERLGFLSAHHARR